MPKRPQQLTVLGEMLPVYIPPSDFIVSAFVAWHEGSPALNINRKEVAGFIEVPLSRLSESAVRKHETVERGPTFMEVPYFAIDGHKIWGATAMMLSELLELLSGLLVLIGFRFRFLSRLLLRSGLLEFLCRRRSSVGCGF